MYNPEYRAWLNMKQRCFNKNSPVYKHYGARGITVYPKWIHDFESFYKYIGPKPNKKFSLDRIDNEKGYYPGNIRWASSSQQINNRRAAEETGLVHDRRLRGKSGVCFRKNRSRWIAVIYPTKHSPKIHLGSFVTEEEARARIIEYEISN